VLRANAVGSLQNQPKVLMNLKLKDPTNQFPSFQTQAFNLKNMKLVIKENEAGD